MQAEAEELQHFLSESCGEWHAVKVVLAHCLESVQAFFGNWLELFHVFELFVLLLQVKAPKEYQKSDGTAIFKYCL